MIESPSVIGVSVWEYMGNANMIDSKADIHIFADGLIIRINVWLICLKLLQIYALVAGCANIHVEMALRVRLV